MPSSSTTNCSEGSVALSSVTVNPVIGCIGSPFSASTSATITPGQIIVTTSYTNANPDSTNTCSGDTTTNTVSPSPAYTWTVSGPGSFSAAGSGLSASFTPTNCGSGTVTFTGKWTDTCDTNQSSTSASGSFQVDAVTSLTPNAGLLVDDGDNDPDTATYLVQYGCNATITVAAGDCLDLSPADLPSCWSMTGGTEIDKKDHSVDGNTVGKTVINVTCGTSHKTVTIIVYQAKFELDADAGNCAYNEGHTWWNLTVQPSDVYPFLKKTDGTLLSGFLGTAGYDCDGDTACCISDNCYGFLARNSSGHTASCSYWWCISFGRLISALTYVADLSVSDQIYNPCSNSCVTQALAVSSAAGIPMSISGSWVGGCVSPCDVCSYLDDNWYPVPETCQCQ